ncbi:MAG: hypothetical protein WC091_25055 [Sulfuricellaceae bacterium]
MTYNPDLKTAALRHFSDGRKLHDDNRFDNAGYHYGFAAECALKHCLRNVGVRDDDDAIWKHFPTLRDIARLSIKTRSAAPLRKVLERSSFMQFWDTKMRYATDGAIDAKRAEKWRSDANEVIGLLYTHN